jgi:hypothetical protein
MTEPVSSESAAQTPAVAEIEGGAPGKVLSEAAKRALAEAAERRAQAEAVAAMPGEDGGPAGLEPTRYGDWERKGVAVDF